MSAKIEPWIVIGRFGRTHGIKGLISLISCTQPRENILNYTDWHIPTKNGYQPIKVLQIYEQHKSILAQIDGFETREQVATLTNLDIVVSNSQLPLLPTGEYYWSQLLGMRVINRQGVVLGEITEMMATGSNDVMVISGEKRHMVPYLIGEFIDQIDTVNRVITVDWDPNF